MTVEATTLPDHFENQQAMEELVDRVHGNITAENEARELENMPAEKPAEIVTRKAAPETTGVENSAGTNAAATAADPSAGKTGDGQTKEVEQKTIPDQEWLDSDLRSTALSIGVPENTLSEFGSRQELERLINIFDAKAIEAGKQQFANAGGQASQQAAPATKTEEVNPAVSVVTPAKPEVKATEEEVSQYLLSNEFDPDLAKSHNQFVTAAVTRMKALEDKLSRFESMEQRLAGFEAKEQQREVRQVVDNFNSIVDNIGQPDLFGTGNSCTKEQLENRSRLWDAHRAHVTGLLSQGRQAATDQAFVSRALFLEFGPQLVNNEKKQVISRLQQQSGKRMGGPSGKPMKAVSNGKESPTESAETMAELVAEFKRLEAGGD